MQASRFFQLAAVGLASILLLTFFLHQHFESHRQNAEVKSMVSYFLQSVTGLDKRFQDQAEKITSQSQNLSAHVKELNHAVASMFAQIEALSSSRLTATPQASLASMFPDYSLATTSETIEKGTLFRACVTNRVSELTSKFQITLSQEPQNQMRIAVERRLQLSGVIRKCGGSSNFVSAAAATVDDYMKWASAEIKKDDGRASKVVVIKTSNEAGLGNRLQAMTSAFLFAIVTKRLLLVDWAENMNAINLPSNEQSGMPPLEALFVPPYKWSVRDEHIGNVKRALASANRARANLNGHSHRGGDNKGGQYEEFLCRNVTLWFEGADVVEIEGYDWWGPTLANNQNHFAAVFSSFGPNSFPGLFNGLLRPSVDVQRILDEQRLELSNYYVIGVQMRVVGLRLSKQAEEHVWRTMLFLKSRAETFQTKQVVFYVCADSKDVWDRTVAMFGKDIMFSASISAGRVGRVTKENLQYGVVDLFILGECDDIILSPESTYGGVAAGRLGKSSWRITKNPEDFQDPYDAKRLVAAPTGSSPCSFGWQFAPQAHCYSKFHFVPEQQNQEHDLCRTM